MLRNFHTLQEPEIARCLKGERVNRVGEQNPSRPKVDHAVVLDWKGLLEVLTVLEENTIPQGVEIFDISTPCFNFEKVSAFISFLEIFRVVPAHRVQGLVYVADVVDQKA